MGTEDEQQIDRQEDRDEAASEPTFGQPVENDGPTNQTRNGGSGLANGASQMAKDQATKFLADKARAAALQAIRSAAIAAWSWLSAAIGPYAAVIIIVLLLIVLLAGPALALWNKAGRGNWGNQQPAYASFNDPADSAILQEFFSNINGGDPAKLKAFSETIKSKVANGDLHFKDDVKAMAILDEIISLCDQALSSGGTLDQAKAMELKAELIDLFDSDNPVGLPGLFHHPFGSKNIPSFGRTLHGRSVQRTTHVSGHNVFNGYSHPGTGDATDLKGSKGTQLYAMFSGVSALPVTSSSKARDHCVVLRSDPDKYPNKIEAWYCHVGNKNLGQLEAGEPIATLGRGGISHVHLEVWVDGKSLHTTSSDLASGRYDQKGRYLWDHIRLAFGFTHD